LKEIVILPFRIEKLDPSGAMLLHLSSRHWLDAFVPSWEKHLDTLVKNVSSNLETAESAVDVDIARSVDQPTKTKKGSLKLIGIAAAVLVVAIAAIIGIPKLFNLPENTPTELATTKTPPSLTVSVAEVGSSTPAGIGSPTPSIVSSPTPIPLVWTRLSSGQAFARDTITAIVIDPEDPEVLYVGTENAGIYKSIDGGVSWTPANRGLGRASIDTLAIDTLESRVLYTGTLTAGIYKTTDSGETWQEVNNGIELPGWDWTSILRIDPEDDQHLYYTNGLDIYESQDGAGSWIEGERHSSGFALTSLVLHPSVERTLYATSYTGDNWEYDHKVWSTKNRGLTWTLMGLRTDKWIHFGSLHIDDQEGNFLFVSLWDEDEGNSEYVSSDGGYTWDRSILNDSCYAFAFSPEEATVAYCVTYGRLLKTTDGGQSWHEVTTHEWEEETQTMLFSPHTPGTLFVGGKGLYLSTDEGSSWLARNNGLGAGFQELRVDPTNNSILYVEMADGWLYQSSDAGRSWKLIEDEGRGLAIDVTNGTLYRAAGENLIRSQDKGETWVRHGGSPKGFMEDVEINPVQPDVMYSAGPCGVGERCTFISSDGGNSWQSAFIPVRGSENGIVIDRTTGQRVYVIDWVSVYRSFDGGETWKFCGEPGYQIAHYGSRMAVNPQDSDRLFLATRGDGVLMSPNGCRGWQRSNQGLGNLFVNTVAIDPIDPDTIYAGTDGGAYVSFDGGDSWAGINDGLMGGMVVYSIVVDPVDPTNVYAATPLGIFKLEGK
jgi:photosystem II stability/assembly factor-like uncharacterized protein